MKFKELKQQITNKKMSMANNFRAKCEELRVLEQENKMMKQMLMNKSEANLNERSSKLDVVSKASFIQKRELLPATQSPG